MKITVWEGIKLSAWLITSFLIGLMAVVYIIDYNDHSMSILFYINKIFIIIVMWILLYLSRFIYNKMMTLDKRKKE